METLYFYGLPIDSLICIWRALQGIIPEFLLKNFQICLSALVLVSLLVSFYSFSFCSFILSLLFRWFIFAFQDFFFFYLVLSLIFFCHLPFLTGIISFWLLELNWSNCLLIEWWACSCKNFNANTHCCFSMEYWRNWWHLSLC